MKEKEETSKKLSNIDVFGLIAGVIGLLTDCVSLTSLFGSDLDSTPALSIRLLILSSLIYSIALINFYTRLFFRRRSTKKGENLNKKEMEVIELASNQMTALIGFPLIITYFILTYSSNPFFKGGLDIIFGLFVGLLIGFILIFLFIVPTVRSVYRAFDASYRLSSGSTTSDPKTHFDDRFR